MEEEDVPLEEEDEDEVPGDDGPGEIVEPVGNGLPTKAAAKAAAAPAVEEDEEEAVAAGGGDEED